MREDEQMRVDKANENRCLICGKPTGVYRIYCEEHRAHAEADDKIIEEAPMEVLFSLIAGIFMRAKLDYMHGEYGDKCDAEVFLRSEWAQELSLSHFDADELITQLDEEIENGLGSAGKHLNHEQW